MGGVKLIWYTQLSNQRFGLQLKCIQILAVHMESHKHPETNSKVFNKNSAIFNTLSWKDTTLDSGCSYGAFVLCH